MFKDTCLVALKRKYQIPCILDLESLRIVDLVSIRRSALE
jgi:hypothetical protein